MGYDGTESESHTANSQNGGSFSVSLLTLFGNINTTVKYRSTESITRTYKNYATCNDSSKEYISRGVGYVFIYTSVKYGYTTITYNCGNADYDIINSFLYIGDSGWVSTSTCEK